MVITRLISSVVTWLTYNSVGGITAGSITLLDKQRCNSFVEQQLFLQTLLLDNSLDNSFVNHVIKCFV